MNFKQITPLMPSDKLAEIKRFYCEHLGFRPSFDSPEFLSMRCGGREVAFMKPSEEQPCFPTTICIEVDDVDAEHERLAKEGVTPTVPLRDNPWGDRSFIVVDPAGVALYIHTPIEPDEQYKQYFVEQ
jgi:catechol 2,3-dioxygenase-like lactoylglutathione lyase family enzyme